MVRLQGVVKIGFIMRCETGLRIGGIARGGEIGGVENIIVRDPLTQEPYIPGSSLKGAMRSRYEIYRELSLSGKLAVRIHLCDDPNCDVCVVFGRMPELLEKGAEGSSEVFNLTRLRVRDAFATDRTREKWNVLGDVELKGENAIDRLTSKANPRQVERIPRGSEFDCGMSFFIFDGKGDINRLRVVFEALKLVEEDYLGAYGSRGYGRVSFKDFRFKVLNREYFANPVDANVKRLDLPVNLDGVFSQLHEVVEGIRVFLNLPERGV